VLKLRVEAAQSSEAGESSVDGRHPLERYWWASPSLPHLGLYCPLPERRRRLSRNPATTGFGSPR